MLTRSSFVIIFSSHLMSYSKISEIKSPSLNDLIVNKNGNFYLRLFHASKGQNKNTWMGGHIMNSLFSLSDLKELHVRKFIHSKNHLLNADMKLFISV